MYICFYGHCSNLGCLESIKMSGVSKYALSNANLAELKIIIKECHAAN